MCYKEIPFHSTKDILFKSPEVMGNWATPHLKITPVITEPGFAIFANTQIFRQLITDIEKS